MSEIVEKSNDQSMEITDKTKDVNLATLISDGKNPRGIPAAKFIDNLEEFLNDTSVEASIGAYNDLYQKYKYMEKNFDKSKSVYKSKIPEIEQTLELIKVLKTKQDEGEEMTTNYNLCDMVYAKAKVDTDVGKVCLWIGAQTMVEFTYDEAIDMLEVQLVQSHEKIQELDEDLYFLRGNSITVEVNIARLFNHSVKLKKQREASLAAASNIKEITNS